MKPKVVESLGRSVARSIDQHQATSVSSVPAPPKLIVCRDFSLFYVGWRCPVGGVVEQVKHKWKVCVYLAPSLGRWVLLLCRRCCSEYDRILFVSRCRSEHDRIQGGPRPIRTGLIDPDGPDRKPGGRVGRGVILLELPHNHLSPRGLVGSLMCQLYHRIICAYLLDNT